jgi:hypothetical protein
MEEREGGGGKWSGEKKEDVGARATYVTFAALIKVTGSTQTQKYNRYVDTEKSEREKEKGSS